MEKLIIVLLLFVYSNIKAQTHHITYKNMLYEWNNNTNQWEQDGVTYNDIKIFVYKDDLFIDSKLPSHYTTYELVYNKIVDGVRDRMYKAYDEHNKTLKIIVQEYKGEIWYSIVYDDVMFTYCCLY